MTGPFSTRRRADEFDAALSRPFTEQDATKFAELLVVVRDLRALPTPAPRTEFVSSLRSQLMIEAETALLPQPARRLTPDEQRLALPVRALRRDRRLATVLGGAALIGATASMAVAAQTAVPGESLYPIKLALEEAQTGIARSDTARGEAMLANARGRLDEIGVLADRGTPGTVSAVESTLESFSEQAGEASDVLLSAYGETGDPAVITELRSFTSTSMDKLSALESSLPAATHDELVLAGERLADIDRRALELCPSCGGAPTSIPPNLLASNDTSDVGTVILTASQDPALLEPARTRPRPTAPASPDPLSGQDLTGLQVPDLQVPDPTQTPTPVASETVGEETGVPGTKVDVKADVSDVTKLLTGDLSSSTDALPGADAVLGGVDNTLDGTVDGLQGTLDDTAGSLVP